MKLTVEMILRSLNQIRRVYVDRLQERMPEENLSPNEISILILLSNNPHITTAAQLCVLLGVSKSLISRSVERLTRRGILCARQDTRDHRLIHLTLSERSKPLIDHLQEEIAVINHSVLADISEAEITQMAATMRKITERFQREESK